MFCEFNLVWILSLVLGGFRVCLFLVKAKHTIKLCTKMVPDLLVGSSPIL